MANPQQPAMRRGKKGGATPEDSQSLKASQPERQAPAAGHGQGRTRSGGKGKAKGEAGTVPESQQPDHP